MKTSKCFCRKPKCSKVHNRCLRCNGAARDDERFDVYGEDAKSLTALLEKGFFLVVFEAGTELFYRKGKAFEVEMLLHKDWQEAQRKEDLFEWVPSLKFDTLSELFAELHDETLYPVVNSIELY